ncbi:MAG TPA: hypothetical protein VHU19_00030 [Pyrinomonadaceae bacterium]|jgi:hypothetical protein|nr:hypothetical protein [Pyrinomonadaceae bacterium]
MRTRGSRFVIFVLILAVVAAGLAVFVVKRSRSRVVAPALATAEPAPVQRSLPPLPQRPLSPRLKALRERAMAEASSVRGLDWTGEVGMTELSGWEYGTRTKEIADVLGTDDLKNLSRLAVAGGMLPEGTDLASLAVSFTAATAGATYSPLDKQVLLVSDAPKGFRDEGLLAHEFVHALQDQHFDLLKMITARPFSFDREEAAFALVEGDAVSVERRVEQGEAWSHKSLDDIAREEDERYAAYRKGIGAFFPPLLTETFIFRYRDGLRFVEAMRRARPAVRLDDVFRRPPASSEQVLHPEKYLSNEQPREVVLDDQGFADEGWRLTATTPLGEVGVRGLLLAGIPAEEARRAAAGWGGDRTYLFEREGHAPLFVWKTIWDKPSDALEFFRAYNALLAGRASAAASTTEGDPERVWREGALLTRVRVEGEVVTIVRGAEADAAAAMPIALGQ